MFNFELLFIRGYYLIKQLIWSIKSGRFEDFGEAEKYRGAVVFSVGFFQ